MSIAQQIVDRHSHHLIGNYGKLPAVFTRGNGSTLWDADGKSYIDLFAGFGGTVLGHAHPDLIKAIYLQSQMLWHVGNQFYTEPQVRLAEAIRAASFEGRAFFCHSGAEAAEAAIKLARISGGPDRKQIVSMLKGFHGRTLGALSATAGPAQQGFEPLVPDFVQVPFDDLSALEEVMSERTAAVIMEPIQSEGGMNVPSPQYIAGVRSLCDQTGAALIFDEVWTGVGRTGKFFGHQHVGVTPDIMTMGKALGGGLPVGGIWAVPERASFFKPGTHGCTLGGNPICAAVSAEVFSVINRDNLLARAADGGKQIIHFLQSSRNASKIADIRGRGLFIGVQLGVPDATPLLHRCLEMGLVVNVTQKNVLRICPALTITEGQLQQGLELLDKALDKM
jgi:acetylornithine/N-succinyldiaminopimelate aminotransferase